MRYYFAVFIMLILRLFKETEAPKIHFIQIIRNFQHENISIFFAITIIHIIRENN